MGLGGVLLLKVGGLGVELGCPLVGLRSPSMSPSSTLLPNAIVLVGHTTRLLLVPTAALSTLSYLLADQLESLDQLLGVPAQRRRPTLKGDGMSVDQVWALAFVRLSHRSFARSFPRRGGEVTE